MRANEQAEQQIESSQAESAQVVLPAREPYTPPVIEKFPPMGNVTFGTNVQPMIAMGLAGV